MELAEAWKFVSKQKVLSEQLKRLAGGVSARLCLHPWTVYGGDIGFYWQQRRSDSYDRELAFAVPADECLDKTDEEVAALVEKHIPGYANTLERARAEQKRRQQIRVRYNNEQISWKREQARKRAECEVCRTPIVGAIRLKRYCSARCRQAAHRLK